MEKWVKTTIIGIVIILAIFIPIASTYPDGLERVVEALGIGEGTPIWHAPMPDYTVEALTNPYLSTLIAGLIGFGIVISITWITGRILKARKDGQ